MAQMHYIIVIRCRCLKPFRIPRSAGALARARNKQTSDQPVLKKHKYRRTMIETKEPVVMLAGMHKIRAMITAYTGEES